MKKIVLCVLIAFIFQQCTDQLSEIDSVLISQEEDELANQEFEQSYNDIPFNAFIGRYYKGDSRSSVISERIGDNLNVKNSQQEISHYADKDVGSEWIGDFEFEPGEYEFTVHAGRGIKVLIDDDIVIDDLDNHRQTSYKTFITLQGVHRIVIFYNLDKSQVGDILIEYYTALRNARNLTILNDSNKSVKDFTTSIRQSMQNKINEQFDLDWEKVRDN